MVKRCISAARKMPAHIAADLKHYAEARKRTHIAVSVGIVFVDICAAITIHEPMFHITLASVFGAWEVAVKAVE